jgi:hypothetical protein
MIGEKSKVDFRETGEPEAVRGGGQRTEVRGQKTGGVGQFM